MRKIDKNSQYCCYRKFNHVPSVNYSQVENKVMNFLTFFLFYIYNLLETNDFYQKT